MADQDSQTQRPLLGVVGTYPGDLAALAEWAYSQDGDPPSEWVEWVKQFFQVKAKLHFYVGCIRANGAVEWEDPYPHVHTESMGWEPSTRTVLTYVGVPVEGGAFALGGTSPDDPYIDIPVTLGLTTRVDAKTWHGVRPVKVGMRIAVIATGQKVPMSE